MEYYRSALGYVRDAQPQDIAKLKDHLRQTTVDELAVLHNYTPEQSLVFSLANSVFAFSVIVDEDVYAMGGIYQPENLLDNKAEIWFLSSTKLDKVETSFLRQCRRFMRGLLDMYPILYNYVDVRNGPAIMWLKWIGARFGAIVERGENKMPFQLFVFEKKDGLN